MSKHTEIQNQYKGFVAAQEAVAKTNPGKVEVVYKKGEGDSARFDGLFIYDPTENKIVIRPERTFSNECVCVDAEDIPALIKALREFFE